MRGSLLAIMIVTAAPADCREPSELQTFVTSVLDISTYRHASTDLDDDGIQEVLVYAQGPHNCGSGGCNLFVLKRRGGTFRVVTRLSVARPPIRMLPSLTHGWHDLAVRVGGGGIRKPYDVRLRFNGTTYPRNPTVPRATLLTRESGRILLD